MTPGSRGTGSSQHFPLTRCVKGTKSGQDVAHTHHELACRRSTDQFTASRCETPGLCSLAVPEGPESGTPCPGASTSRCTTRRQRWAHPRAGPGERLPLGPGAWSVGCRTESLGSWVAGGWSPPPSGSWRHGGWPWPAQASGGAPVGADFSLGNLKSECWPPFRVLCSVH